MNKDHLISFLAGIVVGTALGVLVGDEDKKRIQKALSKQAERLRRECNPIQESAAKIKQFVKAHLK